MKVLMAAMDLSKNGIDTWVHNYCMNMKKTNIEIHLLVFSSCDLDGQYAKNLLSAGVIIHKIPRYSENIFKSFSSTYEIIKKENFDLVHIHHDYMSSFILMIAKILHVPIRIAHAHTTKLPQSIKSIPYRIFKMGIPLTATHFMAPSIESGINMFGNKIVNSDAFYLINNAIESEKFRFDIQKRISMRQQFNLQEELAIGIVGRLSLVKNHQFFIEIAEQLQGDYKFYIIGDGELLSSLEDAVSQYEHVFLVGNVDNVENYYNMLDILLMPSFYEGIPLTLIEAQCSGIQCIISDKIDAQSIKNPSTKRLPLLLEDWVSAIKNIELDNREEASSLVINNVVDSGYDIVREAENLEELYMTLYKKEESEG